MSESAQTISKRELKRQAKLAREQAEKDINAGGLESIKPEAGSVLPLLEDATGSPQPTQEAKKSPYVEPIQRRIRAYLKKKQKIDQLTERSQDPEEAKKLNADQLEILARRDQVLAPLKELQGLAEQLADLDTQQSQLAAETDASKLKSHAEAVSAAKAEGMQEGKKVLTSLISFLGYASVLRANPTPDSDFNNASEKLLTLVYTGGEESSQAAFNLESGSEDLVDGTTISYKRIRDAICGTEEQPEPSADDTPAESKANGVSEYAGSNFISLSEVASHPSSIGAGGISFLNESEIEGVHAPEENDVSAPEPTAAPGPSQSVITHEGNKEGNVAVDWNAKSSMDWADEDPIESPISAPSQKASAATPTAAVPRSNKSNAAASAVPEEFKTIEGRQRPARGRGEGRGRVSCITSRA